MFPREVLVLRSTGLYTMSKTPAHAVATAFQLVNVKLGNPMRSNVDEKNSLKNRRQPSVINRIFLIIHAEITNA